MATLADELLADLEDLQQEQFQDDNNDGGGGIGVEDQSIDNRQQRLDMSVGRTVQDVCSLWNSEELQTMMANIKRFLENADSEGGSNEEYDVIVHANGRVADIENEIVLVTKLLRDLYSKRFPELEGLVQRPIDYAKTVQLLKNDIKVSKYDKELREILPAATVMVITVTSTHTAGQPLTTADLEQCLQCTNCILELNDARLAIIEYVESRMSIIAPNISAIVGSKTAAQMLGAAGGLKSLSAIPSCNIPMLGSSKVDLAGLSSTNPSLRNGIIYGCSLLMSTSNAEFRKKLVRIISGKVALAARVDCAKESLDGAIGRRFRAEIDEKLDKLLEPPASGEVRALEAPMEKPKVRRGGKRARKIKEKFAVTELEKQQNRLAFGQPEEEVMVFDESEGLGMINQSIGTGRVRAAVVDNRVKAKLKPNALKKYNAGGRSTSSGLSSSLVFTPVQGMELVDPATKAKQLKEINEKWFSSNSKFIKNNNNNVAGQKRQNEDDG